MNLRKQGQDLVPGDVIELQGKRLIIRSVGWCIDDLYETKVRMVEFENDDRTIYMDGHVMMKMHVEGDDE